MKKASAAALRAVIFGSPPETLVGFQAPSAKSARIQGLGRGPAGRHIEAVTCKPTLRMPSTAMSGVRVAGYP